jgi:hypothetical protein
VTPLQILQEELKTFPGPSSRILGRFAVYPLLATSSASQTPLPTNSAPILQYCEMLTMLVFVITFIKEIIINIENFYLSESACVSAEYAKCRCKFPIFFTVM